MSATCGRPLRAAVCGARFGRVYMAALAEHCHGLELAGIVARGSRRSVACATHYGVPLFTSPDELPDDIDLVCVVVGGALNGGRGAELAGSFLARGLHVVQEHPLTERELGGCLRAAQDAGVYYRLNTHYPHLPPVRLFIAVARALLAVQRPLFVDALCSIVVLNPMLDILGRTLGSLRPWRFEAAAESPGPYRSLAGSIAGVPVTLRVQNQIHPANRDSHAHVLHRIAVGTEGGNLLLVGSQGPVLWCPRMHMPVDVEQAVRVEISAEEHLDLPGVRVLGGLPAPSTREFVGSMWPAATARVLEEARRAILAGEEHRPEGQYQLAACRLTSDLAARLGRVELLHDAEPSILQADQVVIEAAAEAAAAEEAHNQEISYVA